MQNLNNVINFWEVICANKLINLKQMAHTILIIDFHICSRIIIYQLIKYFKKTYVVSPNEEKVCLQNFHKFDQKFHISFS